MDRVWTGRLWFGREWYGMDQSQITTVTNWQFIRVVDMSSLDDPEMYREFSVAILQAFGVQIPDSDDEDEWSTARFYVLPSFLSKAKTIINRARLTDTYVTPEEFDQIVSDPDPNFWWNDDPFRVPDWAHHTSGDVPYINVDRDQELAKFKRFMCGEYQLHIWYSHDSWKSVFNRIFGPESNS